MTCCSRVPRSPSTRQRSCGRIGTSSTRSTRRRRRSRVREREQTMATVRLEHVTRRFGTSAAVEDLSLDVRDKGLLILLGPAGCGKTTTLNMIPGLDAPTEGHIYIDDQPVERVPP